MNIQGKNVFPLNKVSSRYANYYVSADGRIYSTRKTGKLLELLGSKANSWSPRYVTLGGVAERYETVIARAKSHSDFVRETAGDMVVAKAEAGTSGMGFGRTKSANQLIKDKGVMLATVGDNDQLVFGSKPVFHKDAKTARVEAERIAKESGLKVVMLQVVGAVSVGKTVWE